MDSVCIIGAGSSGIAAAQALQARGIDFDCYEVGSQVGGNWRYDNDSSMSSAYRSLHINSSRRRMQYAAYPMPRDLPDYPSHWQVAEYLDEFVDHFGLRESIRFRTEVVKVVPVPTGSTGQPAYAVTVRSRNEYGEPTEPETRIYEHVLVANGHHWCPRWPEPSFPGAETFTGTQIHSHYYRTPDLLEGKRVLVVGMGNSATDIAVESSRVAEQTYLAMRRGAHVLPKYLLGVPTDQVTGSVLARMPLLVQQATLTAMLRISRGKVTDYGLPRPDHAVLQAHPTFSDDLLTRLGHGELSVLSNIDRFEGAKVFFVDGSAYEIDVVVYCTGYKVSLPFLDEKLVLAAGNRPDLYRRVVSPDHPGLYFVGLVQPIGATMPLAEAQAGWVADLVTGVARLPSYDVMRREIRLYHEGLRKRYVASRRHTMQVDSRSYLAELRRERAVGRARVTGEARRRVWSRPGRRS